MQSIITRCSSLLNLLLFGLSQRKHKTNFDWLEIECGFPYIHVETNALYIFQEMQYFAPPIESLQPDTANMMNATTHPIMCG
jgi:hypothetical protein